MPSPSKDLWNGKEKKERWCRQESTPVSACRSSVAEHWRLKPEALGSIPSHHIYFFPFAISKALDDNSTDCRWTVEELSSTGLPMLWFRSLSLMINNTHLNIQQVLPTCSKALYIMVCEIVKYQSTPGCLEFRFLGFMVPPHAIILWIIALHTQLLLLSRTSYPSSISLNSSCSPTSQPIDTQLYILFIRVILLHVRIIHFNVCQPPQKP